MNRWLFLQTSTIVERFGFSLGIHFSGAKKLLRQTVSKVGAPIHHPKYLTRAHSSLVYT